MKKINQIRIIKENQENYSSKSVKRANQMKTTTIIILCLLSFQSQSQSQKPSIFSNPKMLAMNDEDWANFYIAHRHLEPMKTRPQNHFDEMYSSFGFNIQFDVWQDTIVIFQPIQYFKNKCIYQTVWVKDMDSLEMFQNHFPKVKIPKQILAKIK